MFSQKPKLIRTVANDGLTNIYRRRVSLNIIQKSANKFGRKIGFKISPKLRRILTVLFQDKSKIKNDLNSAKMHFRLKFGDSRLNGWWVMVQTGSKWGQFDFQVKFNL